MSGSKGLLCVLNVNSDQDVVKLRILQVLGVDNIKLLSQHIVSRPDVLLSITFRQL